LIKIEFKDFYIKIKIEDFYMSFTYIKKLEF